MPLSSKSEILSFTISDIFKLIEKTFWILYKKKKMLACLHELKYKAKLYKKNVNLSKRTIDKLS